MKENMSIRYDSVITAVEKTQAYASSFSLDIAVELYLCFV